jgi:uncharacterized protein (TIGR03086 family)
MNLIELHRRALDATTKIIARVRPEDLPLPTPCAQWDLRTLLVHLVSENRGFAEAARGGTTAASWSAGTLEPDPATAFAVSAAEVAEAFAADGLLVRPVTIAEYGALPGEVAVMMHLIDTVAHSWDVARTLGEDWALEDDLVEAALTVALRFSPMPRGPGQAFGAPVDVPQDAPAPARLLGHLGRDPEWKSA